MANVDRGGRHDSAHNSSEEAPSYIIPYWLLLAFCGLDSFRLSRNRLQWTEYRPTPPGTGLACCIAALLPAKRRHLVQPSDHPRPRTLHGNSRGHSRPKQPRDTQRPRRPQHREGDEPTSSRCSRAYRLWLNGRLSRLMHSAANTIQIAQSAVASRLRARPGGQPGSGGACWR